MIFGNGTAPAACAIVGLASVFMGIGQANASGIGEMLDYFDSTEVEIRQQGAAALNQISLSALSPQAMRVVREELLIDSLDMAHLSGVRLAWTEEGAEETPIGFGKGW